VFQAETRAALAAMTGGVLVVSPHGDVKVELEHAWGWCGELGTSIAFMSKLDREETDPRDRLRADRRARSHKGHPIHIPMAAPPRSRASGPDHDEDGPSLAISRAQGGRDIRGSRDERQRVP